ERVRERVGGERLARHGCGLEQRESFERPFEAGRIRRDDAIAVDAQADERPVPVTRRVSDDLDHRSRLAATDKEKAPPLPMSSRRENLDLPGGCLAGLGGVSAYPDAGSLYVGVGSNVKRETTNRVGHIGV